MHFSKRRANQRERLEMSEVRGTMSAQTDSDPCLVLQGNIVSDRTLGTG